MVSAEKWNAERTAIHGGMKNAKTAILMKTRD
jgi:hypothetical protein